MLKVYQLNQSNKWIYESNEDNKKKEQTIYAGYLVVIAGTINGENAFTMAGYVVEENEELELANDTLNTTEFFKILEERGLNFERDFDLLINHEEK